MIKVKRLLALFLVSCMALSMAACGNKETEKPEEREFLSNWINVVDFE